MITAPRIIVSLTPLALLLACGTDSDQVVGLQAHSFANSAWSAPVNLGATINTAGFEQQAALSYDSRTLLWASNRPGGAGGFDIWMSTRVPAGN